MPRETAKRLLTRSEEIELAIKIEGGCQQSLEELVTRNLGLVTKIAGDYMGYGLAMEDLVQEGSVGLWKAAQRFRPEKGAKFSTYAIWWIKQKIRRALAHQSRTIRIPVGIVTKINSMHRTSTRLFSEYGREPSDCELAEELGIPVVKVSRMRSAAHSPVSLDSMGESCNEEYRAPLRDIIKDENSALPDAGLLQSERMAQLREACKTLTIREFQIVSRRFGLNGSRVQTLEEVGQHFNLTRERVRQIQEVAECKLRRQMGDLKN